MDQIDYVSNNINIILNVFESVQYLVNCCMGALPI